MHKKNLYIFLFIILMFLPIFINYGYVVKNNTKVINDLYNEKRAKIEQNVELTNMNANIDNTQVINEQVLDNVYSNDLYSVTNIIYLEDSGFVVDGSITLFGDVAINLENTSINYDSTNDICYIDGIILSLNDVREQVLSSIVKSYLVEDNKNVIYGKRTLGENISVNMLEENVETHNVTYEEVKLKKYLGNTYLYNGEKKYAIDGLILSNDYIKDIRINKDYISFNNNEILIMKYNNNINNAYFTESMLINDINIKYGTIVDNETNKVYYVIEKDTPLLIIMNKEIDIIDIFTKASE